jgi:hypothetical protein
VTSPLVQSDEAETAKPAEDDSSSPFNLDSGVVAMSSVLSPKEATGRAALADELVRLQTENEQLREALGSRIVIEQAKGAVSARFGILPQEAFELLRGLSRSQRRRISDFAAEVVKNRGALDETADQLGSRGSR